MKKILVISLLLALVMALVLPTAVVAAHTPDTFAANGVLTGIDVGKVTLITYSVDTGIGTWLVRDRTITGTFLDGDLKGDFSLKYDGVFDTPSQFGNFEGVLKCKNNQFYVSGQVLPLQINYEYGLPMLIITGTWVGKGSLRVQGNFQAYMVFQHDEVGHVTSIEASGFSLSMGPNGVGQN